MTHGVDGYSMAMDFRVTDDRRASIEALAYEMDEIVLAAGGRFYLAKDSTLRPSVAEAYLGADTIARFKAMKQKYDPEELLQTDLWRRIFANL
jgi:FAD/FMN-containing dehydrogenase